MNIALPLVHVDLSFFRLRRGPQAGARIVSAPSASHRLDKGATLVIDRPQGTTVCCAQGTLWVTHDRDPRDIVLEPGQHHVVDSPRRLLVHALADACVCVTCAPTH